MKDPDKQHNIKSINVTMTNEGNKLRVCKQAGYDTTFIKVNDKLVKIPNATTLKDLHFIIGRLIDEVE